MKYFATLIQGMTYSVSGKKFVKDKRVPIDENLFTYLSGKSIFHCEAEPQVIPEINLAPTELETAIAEASKAAYEAEKVVEPAVKPVGGAIEVADLGTATIKQHQADRKTGRGKGKKL